MWLLMAPRVDRTPSSIRCGITSSAVAYRAKETAPQVLSLLLSTQSIQSLWLERAHEETAKAAKTSPHHRQHHEGLNGPSPTRIHFEDRCSAVAAAGFRLRAFRTQLLPHPRIRSLSTSSSLPHRWTAENAGHSIAHQRLSFFFFFWGNPSLTNSDVLQPPTFRLTGRERARRDEMKPSKTHKHQRLTQPTVREYRCCALIPPRRARWCWCCVCRNFISTEMDNESSFEFKF